MTTKAPSTVRPAPEATLEKIAYSCVDGIPTVEPHDLDRLGYNIWLWLKHRRDPLEVAVKTAGARFLISDTEVLERIRGRLQASGIAL